MKKLFKELVEFFEAMLPMFVKKSFPVKALFYFVFFIPYTVIMLFVLLLIYSVEILKEIVKSESFRWFFALPLAIFCIVVLGIKINITKGEKQTANINEIGDLIYLDSIVNDIVVGQCYLYGVQEEFDEIDSLAVLGFKYIDGVPSYQYTWDDTPYDEAKNIVRYEYLPIVLQNMKCELTSHQLAVTVLAEIRMGEKNFLNSAFFKKINQGDLESAGKLLQNEDPVFNVLYLLWNEQITIEELKDCPILSYRYVNWTEEVEEQIVKIKRSGDLQTPIEILQLL